MRTCRSLVPAALCAGLVLASASPGGATPTIPPPDLYRITGHVRDPLGRGIGGAAVVANRLQCNSATDPDGCLARQGVTGSDGSYEIPENSGGSFWMVVSKPGTEGAAAQLDVVVFVPDPVADFSMRYLASGTLARTALSTAAGEATTTLTITSYAPLPGDPGQAGGRSCVKVSDSRRPADPPEGATYDSPAPGGAFTWRSTLRAPQGTTEGAYALSVWADDCAASTRLTTTGAAPYVIDNTPPVISFLTPLDRSNTMFDGPLAAMVTDEGLAGVDPAGTTITLRQGAGSTSYPAPWSASTGWARTDAVALSQGVTYRLEAVALDLAGNAASAAQATEADGGGFRRITATATLASAQIPRTACAITGSDPLAGTQSVRCEDVPLNLGRTDPESTSQFSGEVTLTATTHRGVGAVLHEVNLALAVLVDPLLPGVNRKSGNPWGTITKRFEFEVRDARTTPVTYPTPPLATTLGTLTGTVPITWSAAAVEMATSTTPQMDACPDPSNTLTCVPDPVRALDDPGSPASKYDIRGRYRARAEGDTISAPMMAARPDWLTDQMISQALQGVPVELPVTSPVPPTIGVQPGAWLVFPYPLGADLCTGNFVFRRPDPAGGPPWLGIGTANHCPDADTNDVLIITNPPGGGPPDMRHLGVVHIRGYDPNQQLGNTPRDFALIRIDEDLRDWVNPSIATIGGPCGTYDAPATGEDLKYTGLGGGGTARDGILDSFDEGSFFYLGATFNGDSGSPVRHGSLLSRPEPTEAMGFHTGIYVRKGGCVTDCAVGQRLPWVMTNVVAPEEPGWELWSAC